MSARKVLYITNKNVSDLYLIPSIIQKYGDSVKIATSRSIYEQHKLTRAFDLIICDRASFLLKSDEIDSVNSQCFNIHPSYLPYNRGYFPNFWAHYYGTPSGTTIHNIDPNIDSGKIVSQSRIFFSESETLESSYLMLRKLSVSLFQDTYKILREGVEVKNLGENDPTVGKTFYKADFTGILEQLPKKWQTTIGELKQLNLILPS